MTEDADAPPAAATAAPEAKSGWSEQDRRTLIITIAGTLGANLATVILVGGALVLARGYNKTVGKPALPFLPGTRPAPLWLALIAAIGSVTAVGVGSFLRRERIPAWVWMGSPSIRKAAGRVLIWIGAFGALEAVLILTGIAAGVK